MKKSIKRILLSLIIGILMFCINNNVYAVDRCIYEGEWGTLTITNSLDVINELAKKYKSNYPEIKYKSKDNLYAFIDHTDVPGKKQVLFKNVQYSMSAQITTTTYYNNFEKRAFKTDEWKNVFDQNTNTLNCIDLYYKTEFDDKMGTANDTDIYRFSPTSDNGEYSLKVSPSNVQTNNEEKETEKSCTQAEVDDFINNVINVDMMEHYDSQISPIINDKLHIYDDVWNDDIYKQLVRYTKKPETNPYYSSPNDERLLIVELRNLATADVAEIVKIIKEKRYGCTFTEDQARKITDAYWDRINKKINDALDKALIKIENARNNGLITKEEEEKLKEDIEDTRDDYEKAIEAPLIDWFKTWYSEFSGVPATCTGILDSELVDIINEVLNWLRIIVPIIVIVLGTIDFSKAVLNQEKDELKQAFMNFIKRLIIAVIIFFVPTLIHILVNIINSLKDLTGFTITDLPDCKIR